VLCLPIATKNQFDWLKHPCHYINKVEKHVSEVMSMLEAQCMKELERTSSVCPACFKEGVIHQIDAQVVEEDGKVYIVKECDKHGQFKEIYFNDSNLYHRWMKYRIEGEEYPEVKTSVYDEPALYDTHMSQTVLTNLLITNRCDLRCSYCFMNAGASGVVYEPTLEELREMMKKILLGLQET